MKTLYITLCIITLLGLMLMPTVVITLFIYFITGSINVMIVGFITSYLLVGLFGFAMYCKAETNERFNKDLQKPFSWDWLSD